MQEKHISEYGFYRELMAATGAIMVGAALASAWHKDVVSAVIYGAIGYNLSHSYVDWPRQRDTTPGTPV